MQPVFAEESASAAMGEFVDVAFSESEKIGKTTGKVADTIRGAIVKKP